MNNRAPLVMLLGLLTLAILVLSLPPKLITSHAELRETTPNQKVVTTSVVSVERFSPYEKRLTLANGITARCSCPYAPPFKNMSVEIKGSVQSFRNHSWIEVYSIRVVQ